MNSASREKIKSYPASHRIIWSSRISYDVYSIWNSYHTKCGGQSRIPKTKNLIPHPAKPYRGPRRSLLPYRTKFRRTKFSTDKIFDGQNISSDKIFDTKPKFRHFCTIFAWLLYWNIGQNFRRTKFFVGGNFRHRVEISKIFPTNFCPIRYLKIRGWYSDYRGRNYFVNTRQAKVYTIKRILLGGPETIIRIMELFQLQTIGI